MTECKNVAMAHCAKTGGRGCQQHATSGCNNCPCQADVCAKDPYCCSTKWDSLCVTECGDEGYICE